MITVELRRHEHTTDSGRELSLESMAADTAGLLGHPETEEVDVYGSSLDKLAALQPAMSHPDRVGRLRPALGALPP